jgi:hypothetical protein
MAVWGMMFQYCSIIVEVPGRALPGGDVRPRPIHDPVERNVEETVDYL